MQIGLVGAHDTRGDRAGARPRRLALSTTAGNMVGGGGELDQAQRDAELKLHATAATTPGGVAFKLLEVLDVMRVNAEGELWTYERYMVQSAVENLIELERVRLAALPRR
jgi:hypothetical protein